MKNNIAKMRKSRGLSQESLSESIGICRPQLSNIERGVVKNPGSAALFAVAKEFAPQKVIFFSHGVRYILQVQQNGD